MNDVSISTVLTIQERSESLQSDNDRVGLALTDDNGDGRLWYACPEMREVDMIEAVFLENEGEAGDQGKIKVWISLLAGATFNQDEPVRTKDGQPMECIEYSLQNEDAVLVLTFLEPQKGQQFVYPDVEFCTSLGVLDPGLGVRRKVG